MKWFIGSVATVLLCLLTSADVAWACPLDVRGHVVFTESFANDHAHPPAWCSQQDIVRAARPIKATMSVEDQVRITNEILNDPKLAGDPEAMSAALAEALSPDTSSDTPSDTSSDAPSDAASTATDQGSGDDSAQYATSDGDDMIQGSMGDDDLVGSAGSDKLEKLREANDWADVLEGAGFDMSAVESLAEDDARAQAFFTGRKIKKGADGALKAFGNFFSGGGDDDAQATASDAGAGSTADASDTDASTADAASDETYSERPITGHVLEDVDRTWLEQTMQASHSRVNDRWQNHVDDVFGSGQDESQVNSAIRDARTYIASFQGSSVAMDVIVTAMEEQRVDTAFSDTPMEGIPALPHRQETELVRVSETIQENVSSMRGALDRERYELSQAQRRVDQLHDNLVGNWNTLTEGERQAMRADIALQERNIKRREFRTRVLNDEIKTYNQQAERVRSLTPTHLQ